MRRVALLLVLSLLWACTSASTTTTEAPATSPPSSTTTTTSSTTTSTAPEWPEILVTNDDGVFYIDATGEVTQLVKGRVAYAVDDTRGGLLFQVERGRPLWELRFMFRATEVWWIPQGAAVAEAVLVPTPDSNIDLSLVDAIDIDGRPVVMYVRHDSTMEPGVGPLSWVDALRTFDLDERQVTEIVQVGAYEYGAEFSGGGGQILIFETDYFSSRCGLVGQRPPGSVLPEGFGEWACCECGDPCPIGCVLSSDGSRLAVGMTNGGEETIRVLDIRSGGVIAELGVELWGRSFDLDGGFLLVAEDEGVWKVIDLSDTSRQFIVPVAGLARFVTAPVDINAPVIPPTPAAIQLRADGLGVVSFGDPVDDVVFDLVDVLGPPDDDQTFTSDDTEETVQLRWGGYPAIRFARFISWEKPQLLVAFSDYGPPGEGGEIVPPHLNGWVYSGPGDLPGLGLDTLEGITVGSSVAELQAAYGSDLWLQTEEEPVAPGWHWSALSPKGALRGFLDQDPSALGASVTAISAGWGFDEV